MVVCCEPGAQVPESAGSVVAPSSYTRWYCEENIYQFLARLLSEQRVDAGRLWAVFLSNTCAQLPLWGQKSGDMQHGGYVCYDYHVIAIETFLDQEAVVYDLDSILPCPSSWTAYAAATIKALPQHLRGQFSRSFRVVEALKFLEVFASDRSHMRWPDGSWKAPPPAHPCITARDGVVMNLPEFIRMEMAHQKDSVSAYGQLLDEGAFRQLCSHPQHRSTATELS